MSTLTAIATESDSAVQKRINSSATIDGGIQTISVGDRREDTSNRVAAMLELVTHVQLADGAEAACRALAVVSSEYLQSKRVVVGLCRHEDAVCEVVAISDVDSFSSRLELVQIAQAALQEVIARGEPGVWPSYAGQSRHALLAQRRWAESVGALGMVSGLFRDDRGRVHGGWLIATDNSVWPLPQLLGFLRAAELPLAAALKLQMCAARGPLSKACKKVTDAFRGHRKIVAALTACLVMGVLAIPTTNYVKCPCTLEPVVRRHIAAPFDGPLEKAIVEAGDLVQAGQLLALMDGRETRWELAGVRASYHRAEKERAGHMAAHDSGKAELAKLEADELRLRMEMLEHREEHLRIRSPIDGIVVSGDMKKVEGMPLTVGQNLFEIAPLDAMIVELLVPAEDFAYVQPGMTVSIRLDGSPFTRRDATIERIQPRSEVRDSANVFVAELRMDNRQGELRPGMRGTARVTGNQYALGWNLLRKPLGALVAWLGW